VHQLPQEELSGIYKKDRNTLNAYAINKYGHHLQVGSVSGVKDGVLYNCADHEGCRHTYKIVPEGPLLQPTLYLASDTCHTGTTALRTKRGIHPEVKKIVHQMANAGANPIKIETQLVVDKTVPRTLLPTIEQIRNCVYQRQGSDNAPFSVSDMRDFISLRLMKGPADPRFETLGRTDMIILSHHEGIYL
jgi:hypothetical protein